MQDIRKTIVSIITRSTTKEKPISTTQLLKHFPSVSNQLLNHHLNALHTQGKIKRSEHFGSNGARMWYIPSSKRNNTLVFDVNGAEISWSKVVSMLKGQKNNPYAWDLGNIMNYLSIISLYPEHKDVRKEMHEGLDSVKEQLTTLSARINTIKGIIDALKNDPILNDPDSLRELVLEKIEW